MKVKSIIDSTNIIKYQVYEAYNIYYNNIFIKGIGMSKTSNFTYLDGSIIPNNLIYRENLSDTYYDYNRLYDSVKIGTIIIRTGHDTKYLKKGMKYKISDIKVGSYSHRNYLRLIKVEGFSGWLSPYDFRTLSLAESREISIDEVLGGIISNGRNQAKN